MASREIALEQAQPARLSPWLAGAAFDQVFLIWPGLACLLLVIPYALIGPAVVLPIYTLYLVVFGLPHNYLTWATIAPRASRRGLDFGAVRIAIAISLAVCALLSITLGTAASDWIFSAIALLSIWHVYRQHHGIAKIYDAVQAKRTGDRSIFADRGALNLFFGLASFGVVAWVFTHRDVRFLMSSDESYAFIHPVISRGLFELYLAVTAAAGVVGLKRAVWDRARSGKALPLPQLALMASALASFWVPYAFLPLDAMPLAMAIATIFHNVQYFAFVWLYERNRLPELSELALPQRLVSEGRWKTYFALGLAFSAVVVTVYAIVPRSFGVFLIYFIGVSHYLVDGEIWKSRRNRHLGPAVARISGAT
jgi:hypothetical protein